MKIFNHCFAIAILSGSLLSAQGVQMGGQLTVSSPQGDLAKKEFLDGEIGYGAGLHIFVPIKGGSAIVPRLDYTLYKRTQEVQDVDIDYKINTLMVGADYEYFVSGKAGDGFYLSLGLGYSSLKWEISTGAGSINETKGTLYLAGGAGYAFGRNAGLELRYVHAKYTGLGSSLDSSISEDRTGPSINLSLMLRF